MRKRPRTIRLLRQAATAAILQLDLEHPAALATGRSDRLLDPATLHPQHHLTTTEHPASGRSGRHQANAIGAHSRHTTPGDGRPLAVVEECLVIVLATAEVALDQ